MDITIITILFSLIVWILISVINRKIIEKNKKILTIASIALIIIILFLFKDFQNFIFNIFGGIFVGESFYQNIF